MIKLLNSWCTRCSEAGAHLDHFLLHINTRAGGKLTGLAITARSPIPFGAIDAAIWPER